MSRPRIRTIKPEAWQDEKVGQVSRDARLLFVVLISFADDHGRFRALPSAILGHGFPYDQDAPRKIETWLHEVENSGLIALYEADGVPYGYFPNWSLHQRVNRAADSKLPDPSVNGHGSFSDGSVKAP